MKIVLTLRLLNRTVMQSILFYAGRNEIAVQLTFILNEKN